MEATRWHDRGVPPATRPREPRWGLVLPVKGGAAAKSRLGASASPGLALAIALDCLEAVLGATRAADVVVVSADPVVRAGAEALGARTVDDPGAGLDAAAGTGLAALGAHRPRAVLLADVPCLRPGDLDAALAAAGAHPAAVVPDAGGDGTVLLTRGPGPARPTRFGPGSAAAHEAATGWGAVRLDLDLPRLRRDVDTPADLAGALALGVGPRTTAALRPGGEPR